MDKAAGIKIRGIRFRGVPQGLRELDDAAIRARSADAWVSRQVRGLPSTTPSRRARDMADLARNVRADMLSSQAPEAALATTPDGPLAILPRGTPRRYIAHEAAHATPMLGRSESYARFMGGLMGAKPADASLPRRAAVGLSELAEYGDARRHYRGAARLGWLWNLLRGALPSKSMATGGNKRLGRRLAGRGGG